MPQHHAIRARIAAILIAAACAAACAVFPAPARAAAPSRVDSLVAVETRVRWQSDPAESALAQARRDKLPVFIDFYAVWCAPCKWMDRTVYNDPLLGEVAEGVVMVRVDTDKPQGRILAQRYDIHQYPTLVYLGPDGKETLRWVGPLNLRDCRLNLAQSAVPASGRAQAQAGLDAHPADAMQNAIAMMFFAYRGEVEHVRDLAAAWEKGGGAGRPAQERAVIALALAKAEEIAGRDDRALDAYGRVVSIDADGMWAWRAWLGLSACLERKGQTDEALAAARQAAERGPTLPFLSARVARLTLGAPPLPVPPGVDSGTDGH
jgi:thiol-disulfide isomerase/thioredoxin